MEFLKRAPLRLPRLALLAALTALAALGGCDLVRDPVSVRNSETLVVMHAVLEARTATVRVLLDSSEPMRGDTAAQLRPLSGAQMSIAAEGGARTALREAAVGTPTCRPSGTPESESGLGCYFAELPAGVRSGTRYTLDIRLPDGRDAAGEVLVPGAPEILAPAAEARILIARQPGAERLYGRVPLHLKLPVETGAVQAHVATLTMYLGGAAVPGWCPTYGVQRLSAADTLTLGIPSVLRCTVGQGDSTRVVEPDSALARLHVFAYDSAYARYERNLSAATLRPQDMALGVRGIYGVFAASARTTRSVMLIQER